jgi:hypothetical protein
MTEKQSTTHIESEAIKEGPVTAVNKGHAAGNALLIASNGTIRKLPIPTSDPNDPLLFTKWQKLGIIVSCCWFCKKSLPQYPSDLWIVY